jgi:hypothetical protein
LCLSGVPIRHERLKLRQRIDFTEGAASINTMAGHPGPPNRGTLLRHNWEDSARH